jgi:Fe-S-cluster containining protein
LEYLPSEVRPANGPVERYEVEFNGKLVEMWHDKQDDHNDHHCRYLNKQNALCGVYPRRPFHCDFELIRVFTASTEKPNLLTQQMFGRGWQFLRIDGKRGALCQITERTPQSVDEVLRKLKRLKEWTDHFGLETWLDEIIGWIASGCVRTLFLMPETEIDKQLKILS